MRDAWRVGNTLIVVKRSVERHTVPTMSTESTIRKRWNAEWEATALGREVIEQLRAAEAAGEDSGDRSSSETPEHGFVALLISLTMAQQEAISLLAREVDGLKRQVRVQRQRGVPAPTI